MHICLADLATITSGFPRLASMPPSAGELVAIERIVLTPEAVREGDLYWGLLGRPGDLELAFMNGASGVVSQRSIEPWPGRFCLVVEDAIHALQLLLETLENSDKYESWQLPGDDCRHTAGKKSGGQSSELKDLQLWGHERADIYASTCERVDVDPLDRNCRRRAA